nr:hypothetical protein BaRGS_009857 [Batillaria attramentaria]
MPPLEDTAADFNIVFKRNVTIRTGARTFEDNAHWEPKGKRGEGVSGCVTAHEDTIKNVSFVRKKIKAGSNLRREELKAMLAVEHPGICSLYGLMVHDGAVDILMQDAGCPLRDFLRTLALRGITPDRYWTIVTDLTLQGFKAIHQMHQRDVYHLDIKPENFLAHQNAQHEPVLVLADFGSALIGAQQMDLRLQLTPEYMAPELWKMYRKNGRGPGKPQDQVQATFDTFAFGMTVYFMCTQRHLLLEVLKRKDELIPPEVVQAFTNGKLDPLFGFKFLLMTEYAHYVPQLASMGPWLFPNAPPPDKLVQVIKGTLDPNPETRWTEQDVISFLSGEPAVDDSTREEEEEEDVFKTPTQATDSGSSVYGDVSLEPCLDNVLNLRCEATAAAPVPVHTPVTQCEDADVEREMEPDVQVLNRPVQQMQPMRLNSDVDLMMVDEEEPAQACAVAEKPDFDMDMHRRVTCSQTNVPDPRPVQEGIDMEDLKKAMKKAELGEPGDQAMDDGAGLSQEGAKEMGINMPKFDLLGFDF